MDPMTLLGIFKGLGSLFGGAASASQNAKSQQSNAAAQQANSELAAYVAQQNAKQQQAQDVATRPGQRVSQGVFGDVIGQYKTPSVSWGGAGTIPQISGGMQDVSFSPSTRQSADLMQRDALMRQMQGQGAADITSVGQVPNVTQNYPKESWLDKILGYGALGLGGAESIMGAFKNSTANPVPWNPKPEDPWSQNPTIPRPRQ
jgi:hypothetical protein